MMGVGDICTIWNPDAGPVDERSSWVIGIIVAERKIKSNRKPQFQVHWADDGGDETWYSERDITFDDSPYK